MLIFNLIIFLISCKNTHKEIAINRINLSQKDTVLSYNIYKDDGDIECKKWSTKKHLNILNFVRNFKPIKPIEWNQCFGQYPCGIKGVLIINKKKYNYNLNSGGWMTLKHQNKIKYLGDKNKNDTIYFISVYYCDEDWGD